jgi:hypothetical protein
MWLEEPPGNLAAEACQTRAEVIRLDLAASTDDILICKVDAQHSR